MDNLDKSISELNVSTVYLEIILSPVTIPIDRGTLFTICVFISTKKPKMIVMFFLFFCDRLPNEMNYQSKLAMSEP